MGTELVEQVALVMDGDKPMEMLQIPMRKGLQLFGEGREATVESEMQQLHN